jgi:simple sugar transport system ATP-binding protein
LLAGGLAAARAELARLSRDYGLTVDPDAKIADLSVGEQQRVEILKVLFRGARILILDEPSAVLTPQETDQLFRILATLKERGVTIVLITHKLREIVAATDRVYVMRQGRMVAERRTSETDPEELAELMVGRKVRLQLDKVPAHRGETRLKAEHLRLVDGRGVVLLDDIDLELRAGEIVGVAGVSGNGQTELLQVLAGIRPADQRHAHRVRSHHRCQHPAIRPRCASSVVAHVPEDRLRQAWWRRSAPPRPRSWATTSSAVQSATGCCAAGGRRALRQADGALRRAAARARPALVELLRRQPAEARAGARDGAEPKVLLVGQPTRGVDIGAIEFIHRELVKSRDAGCAVLVVSVELDEILSLADRILVMFAGRSSARSRAARRRTHARPDDGGSQAA